MTNTPTYDRAQRIAKSIKLMIEKNGGTPSHIASVIVRLPALAFDEAERENQLGLHDKRGEHFKLHGVTFVRGDEQKAIEAKAPAHWSKRAAVWA